jgi:hypothetical protein
MRSVRIVAAAIWVGAAAGGTKAEQDQGNRPRIDPRTQLRGRYSHGTLTDTPKHACELTGRM